MRSLAYLELELPINILSSMRVSSSSEDLHAVSRAINLFVRDSKQSKPLNRLLHTVSNLTQYRAHELEKQTNCLIM